MIPKIIHYCWFGGNELNELSIKCIESWKKHCPDYVIIEWNENNFDISASPLYVRQAYEAKKWAFVTDFVRLKVVYDNGGIYLDTDVELIKPLDSLLSNTAFFGFEDKYINTGLGFGAEKGTDILKELMHQYNEIPFYLSEKEYDFTPCPERNIEVFLQHGLLVDGKKQILEGNIAILPKDYLCPKDYYTGHINPTNNTIAIHHFSASWLTQRRKEEDEIVKKYYLKYGKESKKAQKAILNGLRIIALKYSLKDDGFLKTIAFCYKSIFDRFEKK